MVTLVRLEDAKAECRYTDTGELALLERKAEEATDLVVRLLKAEAKVTGSPVEWTAETVPPRVRAMILHVTVHLWRHRGDGDQGKGTWLAAIEDMVRMERMPSLA